MQDKIVQCIYLDETTHDINGPSIFSLYNMDEASIESSAEDK